MNAQFVATDCVWVEYTSLNVWVRYRKISYPYAEYDFTALKFWDLLNARFWNLPGEFTYAL